MKIEIHHQEINATNFVNEIAKQVKEYDSQPFYFLRVSQEYCMYEILINNKLVEKQYSLGVLASPIEINHAILKSGTQTVTYRLYPIGDLLKREFEDTDEEVNTLIDETSIKIDVVVANKLKGHDYKFSKEESVIKHTSAVKKDSQDFIASSMPYYEHTFTFDAKVPYENEGWEDAQDLTKLDKEELEGAVLGFYNHYKTFLENNDFDAILRIHYDEILKNAIAQYQSKDKIQRIYDAHRDIALRKDKNFQPLKDYEMGFYSNGKSVALRFPTVNPIDTRTRGEGALFYVYKKNGKSRANFKGIYLYLPKGEALNSLRLL